MAAPLRQAIECVTQQMVSCGGPSPVAVSPTATFAAVVASPATPTLATLNVSMGTSSGVWASSCNVGMCFCSGRLHL